MGLDTNKGLLEYNGRKYAKNRKVDPSKIDWKSIIDKELSDKENWDRIDEEVKKHMDYEDKLDDGGIPHEDQIEAKERQIQEKYIEQIEKEKEKISKAEFKDNEHEEVQQFYDLFNYYIKSICNGHHDAFMVKADPGIGKSYQTTQTLINEVGKDKFKKLPAVSSPFEFYKKLYEHEQDSDEEILVLDDIEGLLRKKKALAILKQATWSETDERYVGWNSSPNKLQNKDGENIPAEFKFTGKLIMIFNEVPEDDVIFDSLQDRCFYYELEFTYEQKCQLIKAISHKGMGYDIDEEQRKEIASWLIDVTTPATDGLNLRTYELGLKHYLASNDQNVDAEDVTWQRVIKESLAIDEDREVARAIIKDGEFTSAGERQDEFKERTGKSGRTYRRARDELKENSEEIAQILE